MTNSTLSPSERGEKFTVPRLDVHDLVTTTIIEQLEKGVIPWQKPWSGPNHQVLGLPQNYVTGNKYNGINIVLLWCSAIKNNYTTSEWGSFKQWQSKNEKVRKGEKGNLVVYYDTIEKEKDGEIQKIPFLKSSYVFNRCQLQSYEPPTPTHEPTSKVSIIEKIDAIEQFVSNTKAIIQQQGDQAFYSPMADRINMPFPEYFEDTASCTATEGYYSTLLHELSHWTGHKDRLNRLEKARFGDKKYANEELVAEFSSAFLCAGFGIATLEKGNHSSYIDNWLSVLREDNRAIFRAASEANKVVEYLLNI
ncbi:ArdC family protein [Mucilaginibacter terrae]|uniref:ArdC family protein n=1 Tax=Mucilaginibacter terrae TaxID=1955052 RepID=UPI003624BF16